MQHTEVEVALRLLHYCVGMRMSYARLGAVPDLPAGKEHLDCNAGILPQDQMARKTTAGAQRRQAISSEGIGDVGSLDSETWRIGQGAGLADRAVVEENHVRLERPGLPMWQLTAICR